MIWALEDENAKIRLGVNVDRLYVQDAGDTEANSWNAYISLKMDRVLLVKPQKLLNKDDKFFKKLF